MAKFIITTTQDCIKQIQYKIEANSLEEAMDKVFYPEIDYEIINEDYDSSGEEFIEEESCYKIEE